MRNVSDKSSTENLNTHFMFNNLKKKSCRLWDNMRNMWEKQAGQRYEYDTAHALCVLANLGYRNTLRIILTAFSWQKYLPKSSSISGCT
jgi:hypothetical protein